MAQRTTEHNLRTTDIDKNIVDNIGNGIIVIDKDLHIYCFNPWLELNTQLNFKDIEGELLHKIFPTINEKTLKRKIRTTLLMGTPTFYTATTSKYLIPIKINQLRNANFEYMHQDVSIVPFNQEKELVSLIITDQTILTHTNTLLQENIQKVQELNKELVKEKELTAYQHKQLLTHSRSAAMGEMISMIAHQWRQPLSLINTLIGSIKVKQELDILDKETMNESFSKIENTVHFLSQTINDFRDYFKPNKEKTLTCLTEIFNKSVYFLKEEMLQYNIDYRLNIDEALKIETHKNELLQSMMNILKNSLDAFKENNVEHAYIQIDAKQVESEIIITIEDNAGGIQEEHLCKIFNPYFSTKSNNGTGLGLYMCQSIIVKQLQGSISITSTENKTYCKVNLPLTII